MGRCQGEEKRTYRAAPSNKHRQTTLFTRENEARIGRATNNAEAEAGFNIKTGELPLFYATSPKLTRSRPIDRNCKVATSPHRLAKRKSEGHGRRREVSADVHLGEGDAERPPVGSHSQEIATWASSFRFELDTHNTRRSQATLERDSRTSRRGLTDSQNWTETPGGSFEFRNGIDELNGNLKHGPHLKLPRRLEENIHNFKLHAIAYTADDNGSENQAGRIDATLQSSNCCDVVSFEARRNVAVDVPNSPERDDILRRLNELKAAHQSASPSLLKLVLDDVSSPSLLKFGSPSLNVASYHKEMAKIAAKRHHLHQRLKTDPCIPSGCPSPLSKSSTSTLVRKPKNRVSRQSEEIITTLSERRLQSTSSSSGLRGSPRRTAPQPAIQELHPIAPTTSRCKQSPRGSSCSSSIHDQLVSIRKLQFPSARTTSNVSNIPSPDHTRFLSGAKGRIPIKWEEEPGNPKTANAANAQRLSQEESNCVEDILQLGSSQKADENIVSESATVVEVIRNDGTPSARSSPVGATVGISDGGRVESHRYYGRAHLRRYSESSYEHSSRRYGTPESLEAQIDLDASAAAKFLVELYDTPLSTPGRHGSSPLFAVPFKWEDAPGKAKLEISVGRPNILQLPPRLAVPSYRSAESFSQDLRASHPFAGFFAPCLTASSPRQQQQQRKQNDRMLVQYGSSKSLPPRAPSSPSPPERRKRHGLVGRCYSTPQEGCQIRVSKSTASSPVLQAVSRNFFDEETKNSSGSWIQKTSRNPNAPSSPRSILCGPDESSSSQTSASIVFSSGDLEDFTEQTNHSGQAASKSSNSSFESIEEDCTELPIPACSNLHPSLHSGEPQASPKESSSHRPQESNPNAMDDPLSNLSKTEKQKTQKQRQQNTTESPEPGVWSPALANYFQSLELTKATSTSTSTSATSTSISDRGPTANGYLNLCKGELPLAPKPEFPTIQSMLSQQQPLQESLSSTQASPKRPTRLPYTMPSVAEQLLASCDNSARRQLVHDLSPRLLQLYPERRLTRSSHGHKSGGTAPAPRVERYHADEVCHTFPAYAAALQLLPPQRQRKGLAKPLTARPRRRARFMVSICKTLKRLVLGRQRRCKIIKRFEPKLVYDYAIVPTTFQFYQPN